MVYAVCSELCKEMRPLIERLKDLATAPDNVIEKKEKEAIRNKNYININMITNNDAPIDIQNDEYFTQNWQYVLIMMKVYHL